eukprot:TRINITY_DN56071_c1_g1_i1.p1 TRINITY_DN56071_c1_g1~~TRINITY_DN56071_c1_g1_i1.p1  ORF type:complete len:325 (+),score=93.88 TRINITY_DN56071_c1_g1_i1:76-1050(+)
MDAARSGGGFTQVHVSGLPADCEDAVVEAALRRVVVAATRRRSAGFPATEDASREVAESAPADGVLAGDDAAGAASAEVTESAPGASKVAEIEASEVVPEQAEALAEDAAKEDSTVEESPAGAEEPVPQAAEGESAARREDAVPAADAVGQADQTGVAGTTSRSVDGEGENVFDDDALAEAFVSCVVVRQKDTGACKGYCFLTFASGSEADAALPVLDGAEFQGVQLQAQPSRPKERHARPSDPVEQLNDLRCRRQRYQAVSKRAQYGHLSVSGQTRSDKTLDGGHAARNEKGRLTGVSGTRGGKTKVLDEKSCKRNSGFARNF